jgi:AcrR family transcriptional regulator
MRPAVSGRLPCPARPYHRGNLRAQLTAVARALLEEEGRAGLGLRAIAARAGVALGTIYHHYDGKGALLAALAVEGFDELSRRLREAVEQRGEGSGLRAMGAAYVGFLFERPALYQLMFEALEDGSRPEVAAAERATFGVVADCIGAERGFEVDPALAEHIATAIWAWGRGIGALGFSGGGAGEGPRPDVVNGALQGLEAIISPPRARWGQAASPDR